MHRLVENAREALMQRRSSLQALGTRVQQGAGTLSEQESRELHDIEDALARIQAGEFGQCARCGGALGRYRMWAIPEARYCLTCSTLMGR
jgi:RNA polymerase-binding transcription factor DksA